MGHFLFASAIGLGVWLVFALVGHFQRRRRAYERGCFPLPHYPHKEPFFGLDYTVQSIRDVVTNRNLLALDERFQKLGPTFQVKTAGTTEILSKDARINHSVYSENYKAWGVAPMRFEALDPYCGVGFITTDGALWEHSRALLKPYFHKSHLSDLSFLSTATDQFMHKIPKDGSTIDLQPLLGLLFLDTAGHFVLGQTIGALSEDSSQNAPLDGLAFVREFQNSMQGLGIRLLTGRARPILPESRWRGSWAAIHNYFDFFIEKEFKESRNSNIQPKENESEDNDFRGSLLSALARSTSDKTEIRNHLIQLMMAAQETTSILVSNALFLLARNPRVWDRLRQEAASLETSGITFHSLWSNELLGQIIKEVLRVYPVFAYLGRVALQDTTLPTGGGPSGDASVFVAAGTVISFSYYSLHRDPSVFGEDAEVFRPDRWKSLNPRPGEYFPFGQGPRQCLGQQKAQVEASFILVKLALAFEKLEPRDDRPWQGAMRLTARNANGCLVGFVPAQ